MRLGGTILAAAALLAACSSDPTPIEPDPTPTTSASASPTRPAPTMPAQASEDSPEGAAAFVHHYVDVFNYAAATGNTDELSRLSSPDCEGCQKYISLYRDTYAAGGYFKGGDWKIGGVNLESIGAVTYVSTEVEIQSGTYRESRDDSEFSDPGERTGIQFEVRKGTNGWRTHQLALGGAK